MCIQVYDGADVAAHYQAVEVEDIGRVSNLSPAESLVTERG